MPVYATNPGRLVPIKQKSPGKSPKVPQASPALGVVYVDDLGPAASMQDFIEAHLSPNFTVGEMSRTTSFPEHQDASRLELANTPEHRDNLQRTAQMLEVVRARFGPIYVSSGYRSPTLNSAISGSSSTSQHMTGSAADIWPQGLEGRARSAALIELWNWARANKDRLGFGQLILETNNPWRGSIEDTEWVWVHISLSNRRDRSGRGNTRGQVMTYDPTRGYQVVDAGRVA